MKISSDVVGYAKLWRHGHGREASSAKFSVFKMYSFFKYLSSLWSHLLKIIISENEWFRNEKENKMRKKKNNLFFLIFLSKK